MVWEVKKDIRESPEQKLWLQEKDWRKTNGNMLILECGPNLHTACNKSCLQPASDMPKAVLPERDCRTGCTGSAFVRNVSSLVAIIWKALLFCSRISPCGCTLWERLWYSVNPGQYLVLGLDYARLGWQQFQIFVPTQLCHQSVTGSVKSPEAEEDRNCFHYFFFVIYYRKTDLFMCLFKILKAYVFLSISTAWSNLDFFFFFFI